MAEESNHASVALKSPFDGQLQVIVLPRDFTASQIKKIEILAKSVASMVIGSVDVPPGLADLPMNDLGNAAMSLVSETIPDSFQQEERSILTSMIAANSLAMQILDRVNTGGMVSKQAFVESIKTFGAKYGPHFLSAAILRLIPMRERPKDFIEKGLDSSETFELKASRLFLLCATTLDVLKTLPDNKNISTEQEPNEK